VNNIKMTKESLAKELLAKGPPSASASVCLLNP
jgi:hypothetical protein